MNLTVFGGSKSAEKNLSHTHPTRPHPPKPPPSAQTAPIRPHSAPIRPNRISAWRLGLADQALDGAGATGRLYHVDLRGPGPPLLLRRQSPRRADEALGADLAEVPAEEGAWRRKLATRAVCEV